MIRLFAEKVWARILAPTQTGAPGHPKGIASNPRLHGWGFAFSAPGKRLQEKSARRSAQPIIPVMIAIMKPIAPSQSKSPASVPRFAERNGSILLYMIGLLVDVGDYQRRRAGLVPLC